jgi:dTDP-4-dehydrorhamnose reductase
LENRRFLFSKDWNMWTMNTAPPARHTYLFGATSLLGYNLARLDPDHTLTPFANPHATYPAARHWPVLDLDRACPHFAKCGHAVFIHCDGVCDVEKCERNPEWAREINVGGLARLLDALPDDTRLVYCSSDHVFSGDGNGDGYDEDATPDPISVYGQTRVEAENLVRARRPNALILRVSLGIGPSIDGRSGHLDWLRYRTTRNLPITLVNDEHRSAVWMEDLVRRVRALAESDITGLRHVAATRAISRPELAAYLNRRFAIGARFQVETRAQRRVPHLGRVALRTRHRDALATPLPSVVDAQRGSGRVTPLLPWWAVGGTLCVPTHTGQGV